MKARPTQSREGVKGGSSLRSPEAEPLVGPQLLHRQIYSKRKGQYGNLVAGSEASLRSNFARPQTRPQAAFSTKIKNRLPTPIIA